jgi:hypothetical protein
MSKSTTCPMCKGKGEWCPKVAHVCDNKRCHTCHGTGRVQVTVQDGVQVDAGQVAADPIIGQDVTAEQTTEVRGHREADGIVVVTEMDQRPTEPPLYPCLGCEQINFDDEGNCRTCAAEARELEARIVQAIYGNSPGGTTVSMAKVKRIQTLITTEANRLAEQTAKAYGGCRNCFGKGYATWRHGETYRGRTTNMRDDISYCTCDRGKQLEQQIDRLVGERAKKVGQDALITVALLLQNAGGQVEISAREMVTLDRDVEIETYNNPLTGGRVYRLSTYTRRE